ncbi:MAG: ATP-dependent Clp protease ATP-binding subunit [Candidatus Portnoybacteria bacterium]|nr:ATP-dependent Clp protease ATP-binding subunit [Candidatus Portnoybacteria bacterium]
MPENIAWDEEQLHHHHQGEYAQGPVSTLQQKASSSAWRGLASFSQDLLSKAKNGQLDPLIGRDRELERVIQILSRRTKRNPVLVGDPGVGKTAIVYGLAQKIARREVPISLLDKRIYALNVSSLVAGTMFRGDFEARLEAVIKDIKKLDAILFIDEIHNIVGAGSVTGALDAANILKPSLAEGSLQVIGSTTFEEYKFYIENDKALERRFQPVFVGEPSDEDTKSILKGLRSRYEEFHHVRVSQEAIDAAVKLSSRYIQDHFLPDKALDVLDEACAIAALSRGFKNEIKRVESLRFRVHLVREKKEKELSQGFYEHAFALKREEELLLKRARVLEREIPLKAKPVGVSERDVRKVISTMTGVPVEQLNLGELKKLKMLERELSRELMGQEQAIKALSSVIRRSRLGLNFQSRPLGSFIFIGPSGVGKTELARLLARNIFGGDSFVKLDMSEFMEPHSVARLIGAPAGYIGYGRGGELTEKVRRNPYSLVLFDEIEKAHPQVFNLLLQVLEDGELSDATGLEVDFKNTIVILTSNIGTPLLYDQREEIGFGTAAKVSEPSYEAIQKRALSALSTSLRPELLNRIDEVIVFKPLALSHIREITGLQLKRLVENILQEKQLKVSYNPRLVSWIAKRSFHAREGARLVRKTIEKEIADPLAEKLISGELRTNRPILVSVKGKSIFFNHQ